ncbi:Scaffold attachment factor B1, putative, partial [Ixodes scapularis]
EGSSEVMDADALQLSIEDEEKLLNEEEESFDKSKDEASHQEDASADGGTDSSATPDAKGAKKKGPKAGPKDQDKATSSTEPGAPAKEEGGEEGGDTKKEEAAEAANDAPAGAAPTTTPAKAAAAKSAGGKVASKVAGKSSKDHGKKAVAPTSSGRNLWVSGLSSSTRAADLKALFSKYGKVVTAKIVTNARTPGARCYGFITMGAMEEGTKCIQHLDRTELHGKMISVERTKYEPGGALKRSEAKNNQAKARAASAAAAARKEGKPEAAAAAPKVASTPAKPKTTVKKVVAAATNGKKKVKPKAPVEKAAVNTGKEAATKESNADDGMVVIDENTSKDESKEKHREKRPTVRERRPVRSRSRERPSVRHSSSYPVRRPYERSGMGFFRRPSFYQRGPYFGRPSMGGGNFRSPSFGPHRGAPGGHDMMAARRMRDERMRTRDRLDLREEERRSFHDSMRQRELERKQREESYRLERERERLRQDHCFTCP